MAKLYDVVATTGTYQKDGQTKYLNKNIGSVLETKNGLSIKIDRSFNLAALEGTEDGYAWLKLFEHKPQVGQQQPHRPQQPQQAAPSQDDEDPIPF